MTDHAELRRLSEVATPGEWRTGDGDDSLPDCVLSGEFVVCEHAGGDVDYIAAANPKTVLALLDENDRLKAENDELRRLCSCAKQYDLSMTLRRMIDAVLEGDKP
ncbi:ead/Ea22-like family protein [Pseudomonas aeruginosa]|uniref:ead/Ea22-like family protein n=1 Tax=Pseudomonas aeruginosa TaxID=287 RepID=UPI0021E848F6|nr:ead/Ea22-like family protein [Pseudomonas aeruginosa]MCV3851713.1 ead/Ea22-like family protein [Pseudomonas aeruginosa]MCV3857744.1 ead/Ea22-like family protein [Pseudomonas aeruginosa]